MYPRSPHTHLSSKEPYCAHHMAVEALSERRLGRRVERDCNKTRMRTRTGLTPPISMGQSLSTNHVKLSALLPSGCRLRSCSEIARNFPQTDFEVLVENRPANLDQFRLTLAESFAMVATCQSRPKMPNLSQRGPHANLGQFRPHLRESCPSWAHHVALIDCQPRQNMAERVRRMPGVHFNIALGVAWDQVVRNFRSLGRRMSYAPIGTHAQHAAGIRDRVV